ncbi:MAG TPA: hypothetical protein VHX18_07745 [Rhizomicrobium sp.]|jgi:hypothetical protein|nr:hypothetical protein [Rhizomicrobium sp.]
MKINAIAFAICASAFLASPALAQMAADAPMIKTLAENNKLSVTENWLKPGESAAMASRLGAAIYYIQGGTFEIDYKDGTKTTVTRASGTVRIATDAKPYAPKNIGKTTIHVIVFQPK